LSPRRSRILAVAVLGGQLVLLASQSPDPTGFASSLLAGGSLRLVAPFAALVAAAGSGLSGVGDALRTRSRLAEENGELRAELERMRRERLRRALVDREAEELAAEVEYARRAPFELRAAPVVYLDHLSGLRTLLVRVGARGARHDQVVVCEQGVVGRVIETAGGFARVQLVTDRAAALGVLLEGARRQGIARGAGPDALELEYVPRQAEVRVGDRVVSAGIDGVYPRGLEVGVVSAVDPGDERFLRIRIETAVDFGQLAHVFLIEGPRVPTAAPAESAP